MSSQIYTSASRTARSLIIYASKHKHLVPSEGRTAAAAAAVSYKGTLPALASFSESTNDNKWIAGVIALPAAAYMLQDQEAHASQMERTFIAIKPDGVQRGLVVQEFFKSGLFSKALILNGNIIHGCDGPETAKNEISLWFNSSDITSYSSNQEKWNYIWNQLKMLV